MKYILIAGAKENGKSTTIENVCKKLNPSKAWEFDKLTKTFIEVEVTTIITNGTYIIEVKGKIILVVAGSPTEQEIMITILIKAAIDQGFTITLILAAMRSFEKMEGYDTPKELGKFAQEIETYKIIKIAGDYKKSQEWQDRISKIIHHIQSNL